MKKAKIRDLVSAGISERVLLKILFCYSDYNKYYIPLLQGETLFLGAVEDDFIIDGYSIRRLKDITKAKMKDDMCVEILRREGITEGISVPDVDLSNWEAVFHSLQRRNQNIIVEKESLDEGKSRYVIGRIESIYKKHAYVRHFDADGIWQDEPYRIPYCELTSITFGSRYVDVFSKHLGELPENFGK